MALQLTIAGTDQTALLEQASWSIRQQLSRQGTTCSLNLVTEDSSVSVAILGQIVLSDAALGQTLFAGLVTQIRQKVPGPNLYVWSLSCVDYTYYLDARHVHAKYTGQTADAIIASLLATYPTGITGNHVAPGPAITSITFGHNSLSQALTKIVRVISSPTTNWSWYVDTNRDLHVFDQANAAPSSYYLTDDLSDLSANAVHYARDSFSLLTDAGSLRTNVIVQGADIPSTVTWNDTFVPNGTTASWQLTYTPSLALEAPTLVVNGTIFTWDPTGQGGVTTFAKATGSKSANGYVLTNHPDGTWTLDVAAAAIPTAGTIILTYRFTLPLLLGQANTAAVSAYANAATGHDGKYDVYLNDTAITDFPTAGQRALAQLNAYAWAEKRASLTTTEDSAAYLPAGQLVDVTNTQLGLVSQTYLILGATISGKPGLFVTYALDLVRVS